jgi:hypothetical protein
MKRMRLPNGITVDWTDEGPVVSGFGALLSATETSALLDRWADGFDAILKQERTRMSPDDPGLGPVANLRAVKRAFAKTYNRVPSEEEIMNPDTELAKKFNLFHRFMVAMHFEAFRLKPGEDPAVET